MIPPGIAARLVALRRVAGPTDEPALAYEWGTWLDEGGESYRILIVEETGASSVIEGAHECDGMELERVEGDVPLGEPLEARP